MQFPCPDCRKTIDVPDRYSGRQGPCPHCGRRVAAPPLRPADCDELIKRLRTAVNDDDRESAADALGALGTGATAAVDALLSVACSDKHWIRSACVRALVKIGDDSEKVLRALRHIVFDAHGRNEGGAALTALAEFAKSSDAALDMLLSLQNYDDLQQNVTYRLAKVSRDSPKILTAMIDALSSSNSEVFRSAMDFLLSSPKAAEVLPVIAQKMAQCLDTTTGPPYASLGLLRNQTWRALKFFELHPSFAPAKHIIELELLCDERFHESAAATLEGAGVDVLAEIRKMARPMSTRARIRAFITVFFMEKLLRLGRPLKTCPGCGRTMKLDSRYEMCRLGIHYDDNEITVIGGVEHIWVNGDFTCKRCHLSFKHHELSPAELWTRLSKRINDLHTQA